MGFGKIGKSVSRGVMAALAALANPAAAQQSETYMGIDLNAPAKPVQDAPHALSVPSDLKALLDEGVELGCLAYEPPASFSQTEDRSEQCSEYIARLTAASAASRDATSGSTAVVPDSPLARIPLVTLARMASDNNKRAQLELGIRFEEGRGGVEADLEKALELYRAAARATPSRRGFTRVSSGENETRMGVGAASPRVPGLPEARQRLEALERRLEEQQR